MQINFMLILSFFYGVKIMADELGGADVSGVTLFIYEVRSSRG